MQLQQPWLRYVDVLSVREGTLGLEGMRIRNREGDDLGSVDGVMVALDTDRPLYVVVHAGGWFRNRLFLAPVGEFSLSPDGDALIVRLTKVQVMRFPGFDSIELDGLSDREIRRANAAIAEVFEPGVEYPIDESVTHAWITPPFRTPEWWTSAFAEIEPKVNDAPLPIDAAQPGDVLGIERGGAQVHLGQSPEDELVRRRENLDYERNRAAE